MPNIGTCKWCGEVRPLMKSHIVPRSFYLSERHEPIVAFSGARIERPKKSRTSLWDNSILCDVQETEMMRLDDYAFKALVEGRSQATWLRSADQSIVTDDLGRPTVLQFDHADGGRIKLFALSVLWRAAVSERDEVADVKLGPYENRILEMLKANAPGEPDDFCTIVFLERLEGLAGSAMMPVPTRLDGVNIGSFSCGGFEFSIKTDKRPHPVKPMAARFCLNAGRPPLALLKSMTETKFGREMVDRTLAAASQFGTPWKLGRP